MTEAQVKIQQQTGIPEERFDPSFWQGHRPGARPVDKVIWDSWTPEERKAAGYETYAVWQEASRAWKQRFDPKTGDIGQKHARQELAILDAWPETEQELIRVLHGLGLYDRPEEGRARFRTLLNAFRGASDLSGRFQYDPQTGTVTDVGTSDLTKRGIPRAATADERASIGTDFHRQLMDSLGITRFGDWQRAGRTSVQGRDSGTGYLYATAPDGSIAYYDDLGFQRDPATGARIGHYMGVDDKLAAAMGGGAPGGGGTSPAPGGVSSQPVGVAPSGLPAPLQGLADLLGGVSSDKPFFKTFGESDPLAGLFPDLRTSGFQNILETVNNPQIRAFKSGGYQVGSNLADLFPQAQAFKFGAPARVPQMSTDFIAPPPMPELPAAPKVPDPVPGMRGGHREAAPPRPFVR